MEQGRTQLSQHDMTVSAQGTERSILVIRDQKVILDSDLADIYGVSTKVFNQAVKRNQDRFPEDFMFRLTREEKAEVVTNCYHLRKLKYSHVLPSAFTEHRPLWRLMSTTHRGQLPSACTWSGPSSGFKVWPRLKRTSLENLRISRRGLGSTTKSLRLCLRRSGN